MDKENKPNELDMMKELVSKMYGSDTLNYLICALTTEDELSGKTACDDAVRHLTLMKKALTVMKELPDEQKRKNLIKIIGDSLKICKDRKKSLHAENK
jgi:hypothetical protein